MKACTKCSAVKPASEFYARDSACKECRKTAVRARYRETLPEKHAYEARRNRTPERIARLTAQARLHRQRNPEKYRARTAVNNAIRDGRLQRQPCEVCGERAQGHHEDYSKPIDVRWFCKEHHDDHHGHSVAKAVPL